MAHSIGKTISELRKAKRLTQVELAEKLGVSDKAVSKWESEGGFPEITQFPVLASIFGVSIDYLFNGKERDSIVLMSTMEYCAKSNDPSFLDKFRFDAVDEHGHDVIHYVKQYQSLKVMAEIIKLKGFAPLVDYRWKDRYYLNNFVINEKNFKDCLYYAVLTNTVDCLVKAYKSESDFYKALKDINYKELENTEYFKIFELMLDSAIVTDETRDLVFSFNVETVWTNGISEFFHTAVIHKKQKFVDKYYAKIEAYNTPKAKMLSDLNEEYPYNRRCSRPGFYVEPYAKAKKEIGSFIPILKKTIYNLIEIGELKLAEKYHKLNIYCECDTIDSDILRVAKLKETGASEREIKIQSAIHNGILNIDEILATEDYEIIKEAIENYPIHEFEITKTFSSLLCEWIPRNDYNYRGYASICGSNTKYVSERLSVIGIRQRTQHYEERLPEGIYEVKDFPKTVEEGEELILEVKKDILQKAKEKFDKEDVIKPLTREFFLEQLENANEELVVIKLYVRLEAILKGTYHYKGDFLSMLNRYCYEHERRWDNDREEYYDDEICSYLHKLRITRNNLVHAETVTETMTEEDIIKCIDYICEMK